MPPTPPREVVMSTGPAGGSYAEFGERYREFFARHGIRLRLLSSAGAVENLARLRDSRSGVSIGFAQSGLTTTTESPGLLSLGTICYEPLWFFYRGDIEFDHDMHGLRGKKISVGAQGSGGRALAAELLKRSGIDRKLAEWLPYTPEEAEQKLRAGEIQAALMVASWDSPVVRRLLAADDIAVADFPRADAYVALYPYLDKLVLPAGVGDLAKDHPPADVRLLAPKASLIVRSDLHRAIQYLLLDAASQIHSGPGIFQKAGQFPALESIDLPLSDSARQFYKSGRPLLQRYLPIWLSVLVQQILVLLIPIAGVLYPMFRLAPASYAWLMRRRVFRLYRELKFLEGQLERRGPRQDVSELLTRLDELEQRAQHSKVPAAFAQMLYTLRMHAALVRERLVKASHADAGSRDKRRCDAGACE
jgi:TRAP-type uncharacterized transport system substrate-binding protein